MRNPVSTCRRAMKARRGFTLIETVVTVGLIAVLAAFVIPTVTQKAGSADPVKVQNDLTAITTALGTFANDTRGLYPNEIQSLTVRIDSIGTLKQLDGTTIFPGSAARAWNGPYIAITMPTGGNLVTGYSLNIRDTLVDYDATTNVARIGGAANVDTQLNGTSGAWAATNSRFAAVQINDMPRTYAVELNALFDGTAEATADTTVAQGTGRFRFTKNAATGSTVKAYFLASPVTQ